MGIERGLRQGLQFGGRGTYAHRNGVGVDLDAKLTEFARTLRQQNRGGERGDQEEDSGKILHVKRGTHIGSVPRGISICATSRHNNSYLLTILNPP
jgi:hypothetical protein